MRRATLAGGAVAAAVLLAAGGLAFSGGRDEDEASAAAGRSTATTEIERKDLVETEEVDGTLGYAGAQPVYDRRGGTITGLPAEGSIVKTDHALYEIDGESVYLLDGSFPMYRDLGAGDSGRDVRQLERNLRDLGLDEDGDMTVDGEWDAGTTAALQLWQRRKGLDEDGRLEAGRVVFQRGDRRIGELALEVGQSTRSAGMVLTTTSRRRIVTVDLPTTQTRLAERGARVEVELPDGDEASGRITKVASTAVAEAQADGSEGDPTIELTIRLRRARGSAIDQAPVDVRLESERAKDVLTVPVTALLARSGGEFAVEVVEGDRRRVVAVEPGLYTEGDVEIEGDGLEAGMTVTDARV